MSWEELPLDRIYYDEIVGVPGTVWPIGTPQVPSNNAADVVTMLAARYLRKISIYGLFTVPSAMEGYEFIGHGQYSALDTIDFNGQDVDTSVFRYLNITGAQGGTGHNTMDDCHLVIPTNISGTLFRSLIQQATLRNSTTDMVECSGWQGAAAITVDAPNPLNMFGWSGAVTLGGMTGGIVNIFARGALITILGTCTGGTINIYGDAVVTGAGGGVTINNYTINNKLAGEAPVVGSVTANWNTGVATSGEAGADLVTIGVNDTRHKILSLIVDLSRGGLVGTAVLIKLFMQVDGVENKVYEQSFDATTGPGGKWIVDGTLGIHEVLRVEVESDVVGDDAKTVYYDCMLEEM